MNNSRLTLSERAFLLRVDRGEVKMVRGYSARGGGYTKVYGGEKMLANAMRKGLVIVGSPELGRPAVAALTEAGRRALSESNP